MIKLTMDMNCVVHHVTNNQLAPSTMNANDKLINWRRVYNASRFTAREVSPRPLALGDVSCANSNKSRFAAPGI